MIFDAILAIILGGFIGGIVRALVGFWEHGHQKKTTTWSILAILVFGFVGIVSSAAFSITGISFGLEVLFGVSVLVGYTGSDIINSLFKILKNEGMSL